MNPGEGWTLKYEELRKVQAINCEIVCGVRHYESNRLEPIRRSVSVTIYETLDPEAEIDEIPPLAVLFPLEITQSEGFSQIRLTVEAFDALCREAASIHRDDNLQYTLTTLERA